LQFFNDLDVLYHLAKFGEDRSTRAGCRCENMVFVCLLFCQSRSGRCSLKGTFFDLNYHLPHISRHIIMRNVSGLLFRFTAQLIQFKMMKNI